MIGTLVVKGLKKWKTVTRTCRLCKDYMQRVPFISIANLHIIKNIYESFANSFIYRLLSRFGFDSVDPSRTHTWLYYYKVVLGIIFKLNSTKLIKMINVFNLH